MASLSGTRHRGGRVGPGVESRLGRKVVSSSIGPAKLRWHYLGRGVVIGWRW